MQAAKTMKASMATKAKKAAEPKVYTATKVVKAKETGKHGVEWMLSHVVFHWVYAPPPGHVTKGMKAMKAMKSMKAGKAKKATKSKAKTAAKGSTRRP